MFKYNIYILLILILFNYCISSQTDKLKNKINKDSDYNLDLHLVIGNANGLRAGIRYHFLNKYSLELSYGFATQMLLGSEGYYITGAGINIYPIKSIPILFGLKAMYSYDANPNVIGTREKLYTILPHFGVLTPRDNRIMFHLRGGINFVYKITENELNNRFYLIGALEIGIAVSIF